MTTSAYIHIPFCKSKCKYCSFISYIEEEKVDSYINALIKEIKSRYNKEKLKTLYFGGGTPSLLKPNKITKLIKEFNYDKDCEITLEVNPEDATLEYFKKLYDIGINRISMGAQTFDDNILKIIGRRHNSKQTIKAVEMAQNVGFNNISLDLIYGLPGNYDYKKDLKTITSLNIQHISTYGLKIEENSFFYNNLPQNLPNDDKQADLYLETISYLETKGYTQYEISNFAQKGYESRHNLNYWNNKYYYGFGLAAHGYENEIRYSNYETFGEYLKNPNIHKNIHSVTIQEKLEEEIFLGLRKNKGLNINEINSQYNIDFENKYCQVITKFTPKYLTKTNTGYKLTTDGILLSNNILAEFLE